MFDKVPLCLLPFDSDKFWLFCRLNEGPDSCKDEGLPGLCFWRRLDFLGFVFLGRCETLELLCVALVGDCFPACSCTSCLTCVSAVWSTLLGLKPDRGAEAGLVVVGGSLGWGWANLEWLEPTLLVMGLFNWLAVLGAWILLEMWPLDVRLEDDFDLEISIGELFRDSLCYVFISI